MCLSSDILIQALALEVVKENGLDVDTMPPEDFFTVLEVTLEIMKNKNKEQDDELRGFYLGRQLLKGMN